MGQVFVQALVAQATIERFYRAILLRLTRRDVMPFDPGVLAPGEDGMTSQLDAVVADHNARQPAPFGDSAELTDDPAA
jgi:hypothetical protein